MTPQPAGGWRRLSGTALSRATALNRLAATRLGIEDADDSPVDAAALLQWTADRAAVETFLRLRDEERTGLIGWLSETTGGVADVVFAMAATGKVPDAIPFGLAVAALYGPPPHARPASQEPAGQQPATGTDETFIARVRAEERFLAGTSPEVAALHAFGEAAESLVTRWADNGHAVQATEICARAEAILVDLAGTEDGKQALASRSSVLEAGLDARFTALADALTTALSTVEPVPGSRRRARRGRGGIRRGSRARPQARPRHRDPRGRRRRAPGALARRP